VTAVSRSPSRIASASARSIAPVFAGPRKVPAHPMARGAERLPKPERVQVVPDLSRAGMTDRDRMQAIQAAQDANVRAEAEEKSDEVQEKARDYYNWKASLRRPEQGGD